jgi:RimJ/RimL family protein N-acetyltransferase
MFTRLKRAAAKLNRHLGMSIGQTYLYRLSKADGWSPAAQDGRLKWELLSPAQVGELAQIGWFDEGEGLQRLHRGDRCYTVSIEGRLAHYSWVQRSASHSISEAGLSFPVANGGFWIYHCQTAEWARGRGIYPSTLERIVNDCFAEGDSTAWIYTSKQNIASQKGILRAGFGLVATLHALRMGSQYFPLGRQNNPLIGLDPSDRALPDRGRAPRPAFVSSPAAVDRRQGPPHRDRTPARTAARVNPRETPSRSEL